MRQQIRFVVTLVAWGCLMLLAPFASAQSGNSGLAGQVKDTTGAVMPGVTVEAASPALIEKVRSVVTDDQGLYRLIDLRPGVYNITFSLPGFSTVIREGVDLPANFTATINADLKVGGLEETITVSGQTPVVDVQNTAVRNIIPRDVLDAMPSGRASAGLAAMTPGVTLDNPTAQDVGGAKGEQSVRSGIHGGKASDLRQYVDGLEINMRHESSRQFQPVTEDAEQVVYDMGGGTGESQLGGIRVNFITKDGGNVFHGNFLSNYANDSMQSENLSSDLTARGLTKTSINQIISIWDVSGSLGGPVKKDKLWFFSSQRWWESSNRVAASFFNKTPDSYLYVPDLTRPALNDYTNHTHNIRLTWQVSQKNKLRVSYDYQFRCDCHRPVSNTQAPESSWLQTYPAKVFIATWNYPASNRLLFEAGTARTAYHYFRDPQPGVGDKISVMDTGLNLRYRAASTYENWNNWNGHTRAAMSYVTGTHAVKVGVDWFQVKEHDYERSNQALNYTFRNGVPQSITMFANPFEYKEHLNADLGLYAQDQWTVKHLTINYGFRFDYLNSSVDEQHLPAGPYVTARDYPAVPCALCNTDLSPRLSASYDPFGTGKTAFKVGLGGYLSGGTRSRILNPVQNSVKSATRAWNDVTPVAGGIPRDFIPQAAELGPIDNAAFGGPIVNTRYADNARSGFHNRPYNWQSSVSVQHELLPGTAVTAGYYRTVWANFTVTDNLKIGPGDFDPYCLKVPVDSRLPGGGGNSLCGLYNIRDSVFSAVDNLVTLAKNYGKQVETYDGIDLNINARLPRGAYAGGGMSTGRTVTDNCAVLQDSPQKIFCRVSPPFFMPQVKLYGSYPLPKDFQVAVTFQSLPGIPISASYSAVSATEIQPSLGRPVSGRLASIVIDNLFAPQTQFEGRVNQLDLRLTRAFQVGQLKINPRFDVYNMLNASPVLAIATRFGPTWLQPANIMDARLMKVEIQVSF